MKLRMMTYNIQHGLDYNCRLPGRHPGLGHDIDLTQIAAVIRMQGPDIVALNEVRGLGPAWEYTAQAETIGTAILPPPSGLTEPPPTATPSFPAILCCPPSGS